MADFDNTDRGAAFAPFETQKLILQGKVNDRGNDRKITLIKDQTRDGKQIIEVYEKIGVLFTNDKKGNEAAPDYTGTFDARRIAAWRKMKEDKPYMTLGLSDKMAGKEDGKPAIKSFDDDSIPF